MIRSEHRIVRQMITVLVSAAVLVSWPSSRAAEILPPGFRPTPVGVHVLSGGRVVIRPGVVLEGGSILIRDGLIKAVGKEVTVPGDARVWDMKGTTIYAGFIDAYVMVGSTNAPVSTTDTEPIRQGNWTSDGQKFFGAPGSQTDLGNTGPGSEVVKITPSYRAVRDYSPKESVVDPLRELGFTAGLIAPSKGIIRGTSTLVALVEEDPNEVVLKADVFQHLAFETHEREERAYPGSIMGAIAIIRQSFLDAQHYAADLADYQKNPQNRKRPSFNPALEALQPVAERRLKVMYEPGSALMMDRAARLSSELGLDYCLVSSGQEWRRPDLAKASGAVFIVPLNFPTAPKMPSEDDWTQVTLDQMRVWDWAPENAALLKQQGLEVALTTYGLSDKKKFRQNLRLALDRGLAETNAVAALTTVPARLCGVDKQLGTIEPGKLAYLTVVEGETYFDPKAKVREVWIDGRICRGPVEEPKAKEENGKLSKAASPEEGAPKRDRPAAPKPDEPRNESKPEEKPKEEGQAQKRRVAHAPLEGRGVLAAPTSVLIRNATLWTCGGQGILTNAQLLISDGKIKAIGNINPELEAGMLQIDGDDLHITPGLIDCHNHSMILGAVNESTLPSTAMVRIRDVVNSESDHIYEQLAGGVTTVNLLHGSANPIGGQNCVIKLRDGAGPDDLVFEAAPRGIKFALGENVKQANWGERFTTRFPQTRMGVRTFIENRFTAAREYLREWDAYRQSGGLAPRRDLELEAIGEILQGKRWIHCHSYRQDEILTFLRLMESFQVTVGTLQHVLEGYKVADEIARHGAGASSFSDWWAYKFEVYDAIPYNGSLMHQRGVLVSFNSDSSDLARRLNTEAAKAVKYGGTSEIEALKFVTFNPAKQLKVDQRIGSLEPGKDGDFVIWSKSPLSAETVCLQTWIEGKKYFDRSMDQERTSRRSAERDEILARLKQASRSSSRAPETREDTEHSFFDVSLEHEFDGRDRDCMDDAETTKGGR